MQQYYDTRSRSQLTSPEIYRWAIRRAHSKLVFRQHIMAYLLGSALLTGIYLLTRLLPGFPTYPWLVWPIAAWSAALVLHFLLVFVFSELRDEANFDRMVQDELARKGYR
jgi:hypothetical protein